MHERSYQLDALSLEDRVTTSQIFSHYHLDALNALSGKFNASMIKEFYSNFLTEPRASDFEVVVRNVSVVLRPFVINRVL